MEAEHKKAALNRLKTVRGHIDAVTWEQGSGVSLFYTRLIVIAQQATLGTPYAWPVE